MIDKGVNLIYLDFDFCLQSDPAFRRFNTSEGTHPAENPSGILPVEGSGSVGGKRALTESQSPEKPRFREYHGGWSRIHHAMI
jgi:hypothetical protein